MKVKVAGWLLVSAERNLGGGGCFMIDGGPHTQQTSPVMKPKWQVHDCRGDVSRLETIQTEVSPSEVGFRTMSNGRPSTCVAINLQPYFMVGRALSSAANMLAFTNHRTTHPTNGII